MWLVGWISIIQGVISEYILCQLTKYGLNTLLYGLNTGYLQALSAIPGPFLSASHGPFLSASHGPFLSASHGPFLSASHGPFLSASHGPSW